VGRRRVVRRAGEEKELPILEGQVYQEYVFVHFEPPIALEPEPDPRFVYFGVEPDRYKVVKWPPEEPLFPEVHNWLELLHDNLDMPFSNLALPYIGESVLAVQRVETTMVPFTLPDPSAPVIEGLVTNPFQATYSKVILHCMSHIRPSIGVPWIHGLDFFISKQGTKFVVNGQPGW
jgi:hypothetical protein